MSVFFRRPAAADMTHIALFAALLAVCGWISIPVPPIPVTLQTLGVFSALLLLGGRRGTCAVAVYLLLGAVGLPVFSGFRGGFGVLLEATGGYLPGFLLCTLVYWGVTARLGASIPIMLFGCISGLLACYAFGTLWYLLLYAESSALLPILGSCVFPFLLPDLVKLGLALALYKRLRSRIK